MTSSNYVKRCAYYQTTGIESFILNLQILGPKNLWGPFDPPGCSRVNAFDGEIDPCIAFSDLKIEALKHTKMKLSATVVQL